MPDVLLDIDPSLQPNTSQETEGLLHGPFIDPRNVIYPALELQIFALEMGCVDKNGLDGEKIKKTIEKYVATHGEKGENQSNDRIKQDEVSGYIEQKSIRTIAKTATDIISTIPNLESADRLSAFADDENIRIIEDGYSYFYSPFSPINFCLDGFQIAAERRGIEDVELSSALKQDIDNQRIGGIELSTQSICSTANYFEKVFAHFGMPDLGNEKYIEMATHAILAHEMIHSDLHSMETSQRRSQFADFLTENVSQEDLLKIRSRIEVMSWLMDEIGEEGIQIILGQDHEERQKFKTKIKGRFIEKYGETGGNDGVDSFRQLLNHRYFDLYHYTNLVNYEDAKVNFIFEPVIEEMTLFDGVGNRETEFQNASPTQIIKNMGDNLIQKWYSKIWENGTIPDTARAIVHRLPESVARYVPECILGEQLPSTIERVVYDRLLKGVIAEEQAEKLWQIMDDSTFQPVLRMYPILFDLIKRNGLTLDEYMEMQSSASNSAMSSYSCIREKKHSGEVEELYKASLMNPVLLLGYLVRLEPAILDQVKI